MNTADRELTTERLIDAPRELVFEAWIDQTIEVFHADEGGRQTLGRLAAFVERGDAR